MLELQAEPILQLKAALGEGSIWDLPLGVLYWVDIDKHLLHTFDPSTGKNSTIDVGSQIGTVVKRAEQKGGGRVIGLPHKFAHVDDSGKITVLAEVEQGQNTRMNDGKCDPAGRFWCGSMELQQTPKKANLWMLDTDLTVHHKLSSVTISNGIVWTSDAKTMYYINTPTGQIDAFDYDVSTGAISNRRLAVRNEWGGYFDGSTIDANNHMFVAIWGGGAVHKIDPKNGKLLAKIKVPGATNVTSCAFGGSKLNQLYITTSGDKADLSKEPNAGALFRIDLEDTCGVPAYEFQG